MQDRGHTPPPDEFLDAIAAWAVLQSRLPWGAVVGAVVISRFWGPILEKDAKKVYAYLLE
eukprot:COSAG02_NODE_14057_length_1316_cov_1.304026_1_plen_60_part_00